MITQLWLVASGNFAWLNWITIVLAFSAFSDSGAAVLIPLPEHQFGQTPVWFAVVVVGFTVAVACLSYWPVRNLISRRQRMNASYNRYHLVNSYGAFGTVGRTVTRWCWRDLGHQLG